jgi:hypothetical protein
MRAGTPRGSSASVQGRPDPAGSPVDGLPPSGAAWRTERESDAVDRPGHLG